MEEEKDALFYNLEGVKQLQAHWKQSKTDPKLHLRKLLEDEARNEKMNVKFDHLIMDYSHQNITPQTMELLAKVVKETKLFEKIDKMFKGVYITIYIYVGNYKYIRTKSSNAYGIESFERQRIQSGRS